ncbi:hypothetical protein OMEGA_192 [Klebsiella phage vB_KaeM_KaOmega]|nr:hypothetical protein OMEGA_192 [Klebsiella phage vB_KaeM_KaOmega]
MKDLEKMYKAGTRIIHYANGHRTELKILSTGLVVEYPLATDEEHRDREIALLKERIARDTARLAELEDKQ